MASTQRMLSTSDNPWNPWSDFDAWNTWDMQAGYHTLAYLARIIVSSDELSEADQELAYDQALDEILKLNINGMYIAVAESDTVSS